MQSLTDLMVDRHFTVRALAEVSEVSKSTIENILRGHKSNSPQKPLDIQFETMQKLAKVLNVEIKEVQEFSEALERKKLKEDRLAEVNRQAVKEAGEGIAALSPAISV